MIGGIVTEDGVPLIVLHLDVVQIEFDGESVEAEATFAKVDHALVGTWLLARHLLEIDFPRGTVRLSRTPHPEF